MNRLTRVAVPVLLLAAFASPGYAQQQFGPGYGSPGFGGGTFGGGYTGGIGFQGGAGGPNITPYLGQLTGNPAVNYFNQVRPFTQPQRFDSRFLYQNLGGFQPTREFEDIPEPLVPENAPTGHPVGFMNTGGFFPLGPGGQRGATFLSPFQRQQPTQPKTR